MPNIRDYTCFSLSCKIHIVAKDRIQLIGMSSMALWLCLILLIGSAVAADVPFVFDQKSSGIAGCSSAQIEKASSSSPDLAGVPAASMPPDNATLNFPVVGGGNNSGGMTEKKVGDLKRIFNSRVEPSNPIVRDRAISLAASYSEECSIRQVCRVYEYLKNGNNFTRGWVYVSDPRGTDYFSFANETLAAGKEAGVAGVGDCDDFAILMSALMESIGGATRIILAHNNSTGGHAYAEVYLGKSNAEDNQVEDIIKWIKHEYFVNRVYVHVDTETKEVWLNLDWGAGERGLTHLGGPFFPGDRHIVLNMREGYDKSPLQLPHKYYQVKDLYNKGWNLSNQGKYADATRVFDEVIAIDPDDSFAWCEKGSALTGLHEYDDALKALDESIRIDPYRAHIWNQKGIALFGLKKYIEAVECFDKAIKIDPGHVPAYTGKGYALSELGEYEEAIDSYDMSIHLDPNSSALDWNAKGVALEKLGRNLESKGAFAKAKELGYTG